MPDIVDAIRSLRPNSSWRMIGNNFNEIEWFDDINAKPSRAEVDAEIARLQAEYDAKQYQRDRATEYPSFADQFDTLYHGGYDAWKAQIDAIKAKYPKP